MKLSGPRDDWLDSCGGCTDTEARPAEMTGLDILDHVAYGQTLFHRDTDAWDLLDADGLVAAVLCPRAYHLSIALPKKRLPPVPVGRRIPYGEKVEWKVNAESLAEGKEIVSRLAASQAPDSSKTALE